MSSRSAETNLQTYDTPELASHYASLDYLTPCERLFFDSYVKPGSEILDLGVGGGRTTRYLASRASRYVGVDYAAAMVRACQSKFPSLEFVVSDAADLSAFSDGSFDVVVFAFNGIDYVLPASSRWACLEHIHRVLRVGGVLIFSSHNSRAVLMRPRWNRERLQRIARQLSAGSEVLSALLLAVLTSVRFALALVEAGWATLSRLLRRIPSRVLWRGEGELVDSAHGGLLTHYGTPNRVIAELEALAFRSLRVLGTDYPHASHPYSTDWYYYVSEKCERR